MLGENKQHFVRWLAAYFLAVAIFGTGLHAQDYRAKVQGTVTDSTQAVVVGAKVTLTNVNTGVAAAKTSGGGGQFVFDLVEPGTYSVIVEQAGFNKFVQENILVQVRADISVNPVLTVGNVSEQVTVSELAAPIKFNTSSVDLTIDRKMLTDLPIIGRNPFRLAFLDPSVVDRGWGANNPFDMWGAATIDIGGPTNGKLDLLLDGVPLMMTNKASYAPPMDAVQEFTVQQNSVDAEFGNGAGGTMSLSMTAGTNTLHGTAYYFGRNPMFNAVSDAISRTPNFVRNHIWGASAGHPIIKNKLFAFTVFEQWRIKDPRFNLRTLPTDLERTGDFSQSLNIAGGQRTIYDPWSTLLDASGKVTRTPFPGNRIPNQRLDPAAVRFMEDVWKPNSQGDDITHVNNFKESYTWHSNYWNFSNRVDYNITEKLRIFSRFSQFKNRIDETHIVQTRAMPKDEGGNMFSINPTGDVVYILSANTVLDVTGSYASIQDDYACPTCEVKDSDLAAFWPNKWFAPYTKDLPVMYYPNVNVGDAYFGHRFFWIEHPKNASLHAKVVQTRGRHDLKFGLSWRRNWGFINYPDPMVFNFGPALTSDTFLSPDTSRSGDSYATFLLGAISSDSQAQYISPHELTAVNYAPYFQDDFKLSPRITLNLGLRYEFETAPKDAQDRISRYLDLTSPIPEFQSNPITMPAEVTSIANIPYKWNGAWNFASNNNRGMFVSDKFRIMPRLGIAIRLTDKMSVRAGYSRNVIPGSQMQPFQTTGIRLYGYTALTTVAPSLVGIPGGKLSDPFPATNPLILPQGKSLGRYQNLGDAPAWNYQDLTSLVSDRWTFSIQRQLPGQFRLDATYLFNRSSNVAWGNNLDQSDPNLGYTYKTATARTVDNPFYNYLTPDKFPGQSPKPGESIRGQPPAALSAIHGIDGEPLARPAGPFQFLPNQGPEAVQQRHQLPDGVQLQPRCHPAVFQRRRPVRVQVELHRRHRSAPSHFNERHVRSSVRQRPDAADKRAPSSERRVRRLVQQRPVHVQFRRVSSLRRGGRGRESGHRQSHPRPVLRYLEVPRSAVLHAAHQPVAVSGSYRAPLRQHRRDTVEVLPHPGGPHPAGIQDGSLQPHQQLHGHQSERERHEFAVRALHRPVEPWPRNAVYVAPAFLRRGRGLPGRPGRPALSDGVPRVDHARPTGAGCQSLKTALDFRGISTSPSCSRAK